MPSPTHITGLVLAGGRARRMGGGDKGLLPFHGHPLAARAAARLAPQVTRVLINANRHSAAYAAIAGDPTAVIPDIIQDYPGPLAGIHAGMRAARTDWLLTVPCDAPFFPADLALRLAAAAARHDAAIAYAQAADRAQPVFMLAQCALAADIAATLARGDGKIDRWFTRHRSIAVPFADPTSFHNLNTPQDLQRAETPPPNPPFPKN